MTEPFAELFQKLFYSKTNEKPIVAKLLNEKLARKKFINALDVGAGPGEITKVLNKFAKNLTIVEANPFYKAKLRSCFPMASLIVQDIRQVELKQTFDFILLNQVLYFFPRSEWLDVCTKLMNVLKATGELLIILNDHHVGDLKNIFGPHFDQLKGHLTWDYVPLTDFISDLKKLSWTVSVTPYAYEVNYESELETFTALRDVFYGIKDADVRASNESKFKSLAASFRSPNGKFTITMDAKIISLRKTLFKRED